MNEPTPEQFTPPARVLIIKPSSLGDVVTALPVLRGLRRTFPDAHIAWMLSTACADLLRDEPDLDEIILFERRKLGRCWRSPGALAALLKFRRVLKRGKFDWVIDLQGLLRSGIFSRWTGAKVRAGFADAREGARWFYSHRISTSAAHTVDRNIELARALGLDASGQDMRLSVSEETRAAVAALCAKHSLDDGRFLVCVPPTRWVTKQYPPRHWRRVAASLAERLPVVLLGSPAPAETQLCRRIAEGLGAGVIDLAGATNLTEMVGLISASAGVVCSDSAAKFIAPAVGVDCVTLIGPTRTERTGPYPRGRALVADVPCQGCLKKHCGHITCMESIRPELVIDAAMGMIRKIGAEPCPS